MATVKVVVGKYEYQVTGLKVKENEGGVVSGFVYALNEQDKSQYFGWFRWDKKYRNPIFGYTDQGGNKKKVHKGQIVEYIKWKLGKGTQQQKEVKEMKENDTVIYGRVIAATKKEFDLSVAETVKYINLYVVEGGELDYDKILVYVHRAMADEEVYNDEVAGASAPANSLTKEEEEQIEREEDEHIQEVIRRFPKQFPNAPMPTDEDAPAPSDVDAPLSEEDLDNMPDHAE